MSTSPGAVHIRRARTSGAHRFLTMLGAVALALASGALFTPANAQCTINGPDNVAEGVRYTLCAPSGYAYRWSGPGVANVTSRCITLSGRPAGLYEYTLTLYSGDAFQDRTRSVVPGQHAR